MKKEAQPPARKSADSRTLIVLRSSCVDVGFSWQGEDQSSLIYQK